MDKNKTNHEIVLCTGKIHEFEMAKNILSERKIPFITQQESVSGLKRAAPVTSAPGPAQWWSILVPGQAVHEAKTTLSKLPFEVETNPDIWHFGASEKIKKGWRIFAWMILVLALVFFVLYLTKLFINI